MVARHRKTQGPSALNNDTVTSYWTVARLEIAQQLFEGTTPEELLDACDALITDAADEMFATGCKVEVLRGIDCGDLHPLSPKQGYTLMKSNAEHTVAILRRLGKDVTL